MSLIAYLLWGVFWVVSPMQNVTAQAPKTNSATSNWKLIWREEFNNFKGKIDTDKWQPARRGGSDWNNYMSRKGSLYKVSNGTIKLMGVVNKDKSKDKAAYLTAGLITKDKFSFKYGKIQIRAKFKSAKGAWPALWMLGTNRKKGGWPYIGEIDLMEHLNYENQVYQTVHSYYTVKQGGKNKPQSHLPTKIDHTKFNTYGMEWDKDKIIFLVNGKPTLTYPKQTYRGKYQWPFDDPMYILLTMQIEGNWVGKANPKDYPAWMEVDWVRVWQKK